jgi:Phycobilisome Linker polypeptide
MIAMVNAFVNPVVNPDAKLGISGFDDTAPIELWPTASRSEIDTAIRAIYRQVLGNAHVMESERLVSLESQLQNGAINVQEFVRQLAQSDLYRQRFFENCSALRAVELNFKHLLGRAPESAEEIAEHTQRLVRSGFAAEIDSYLESEEYWEAFGPNQVPFYRGYKTQMGKSMVGFTHMLKLLRGGASSDKDLTAQNRSRLNAAILGNRPSRISPVVGAAGIWQRPSALSQAAVSAVAAAAFVRAPRGQSGAADRQSQFYQAYQPFKDSDPVEYFPSAGAAAAQTVIRAVYRQVLGNAHVMESERLTVAESRLQQGGLSVREFVRTLAKSELYQSRFFTPCYRYRAIELNYKHLLGRAPDNFDEMRYHSSVLDQQGFAADIDTYIDSDEYQTAFGEMMVPYYRGYQTQPGQSLLAFTNLFQLLRSASSSDRDRVGQNQPQLTRALIQNTPYGQLKTRDVAEILAEVFAPKFGAAAIAVPTAIPTPTPAAEQSALQAQTIAQLTQQLADLGPAAGIGAAYLKTDRQSQAPLPQGNDPAAQIARLQAQIADAQRYATIGESRLNKWRSRSFSA